LGGERELWRLTAVVAAPEPSQNLTKLIFSDLSFSQGLSPVRADFPFYGFWIRNFPKSSADSERVSTDQ